MQPWVAIDTETYTTVPLLTPRVVCLSYWFPTGQKGLLSPRLIPAFLSQLDDHVIVGHNVAFDMACLAETFNLWDWVWGRYDNDMVRDTMVRAQLIDIARGSFSAHKSYSLEAITYGAKQGSEWRFRFGELDGIPIRDWPEEAKRYALADAKETGIWWRANEHHQPTDEWLQIKREWALRLAEINGFPIHLDRLDRLSTTLMSDRTQLAAQLKASGLISKSGSLSHKRIREMLPEEAPHTAPTARNPEGQKRIAEECLIDSGIPALQPVARYSALGKKIKLLDTLRKAGELDRQGEWGIIHPSYGMAVTGRVRCWGPNLQQIDKVGGIRELFGSRTGWLNQGDWHTIELCQLAQRCLDLFGWSKLADILRAGGDPHTYTASKMSGCDNPTREMRQKAKPINFGVPGGMGPKTIQATARRDYGVNLTFEESREFRELLLREIFPEVRLLLRYVGDLVEGSGGAATLVLPFSGRVRGGVGFTDGCNSHFQCPAADGAMLAAYRMQRELGGMCLPLHDEFLREGSPEDQAQFETIMIEEMQKTCPDIPIRVEGNAVSTWFSKGG